MYPIFTEEQQRSMDIRDAREEGREEGERVGYQNGERNGREQGRLDNLFANILSVAQTLGKTFAEAMDILRVTPDDRETLGPRFAAL